MGLKITYIENWRYKMNGLSIKEYAHLYGVNRCTVHRWIKQNKLTYELTPSGLKRITGVKVNDKD